ncbi:MAG: hypothetical protein HND55_06970 [Pseudomonadota bacterium]|nr:MAG: hypothetical protein HND55_06970 [Pseudomonadota bacterium]
MRCSILISSARSGTNYFLSVYQQCFPRDLVVKEIFREQGDSLPQLKRALGLSEDRILAMVRTQPSALWRLLMQHAGRSGVGVIAKIFYYHVAADDPLWMLFRRRARIVHLIRRNAFNIFLSREIARKTGQWQVFRHEMPSRRGNRRVHIGRGELEAFMSLHQQRVAAVRTRYADADYHEVFYEDIEDSIDACARRVCAIFGSGQPPEQPKIALKKQKRERNEALVVNYDDVADLDRELTLEPGP